MTRFRILPMVTALALTFPFAEIAQNSVTAQPMTSFAGAWRGICQDGNPFVIVNLRLSGSDLTGDISIANMKGDNGQCAAVIDPPSPEHAMKITDARLEGKTLSFQGSPRARFEMSLESAKSARLKFLGTPAEAMPWQLTRSGDGADRYLVITRERDCRIARPVPSLAESIA